MYGEDFETNPCGHLKFVAPSEKYRSLELSMRALPAQPVLLGIFKYTFWNFAPSTRNSGTKSCDFISAKLGSRTNTTATGVGKWIPTN